MKFKIKGKFSAFTLLELAIVMVIIAIVTVAVSASHNIVNNANLNKAKNLTQNSPVNYTSNLSLWLETTTDASFDKAERINGSVISNWYNINPQVTSPNDATQSIVANKPTYMRNAISKLPALDFDGTNDFMNVVNSDLLNLTNWTFVTVFNVDVNKNYNMLLSKGLAESSENYELFFDLSGNPGFTIQYSEGTRIAVNATANMKVNQNYIGVFTYSVTNGATVYINGQSFSTSGASIGKVPSFNTQNLSIGADNGVSSRYFNGKIGEIIIFSRVLTNSERIAIENYLSNKWKIDTVVSLVSSPSGACSSAPTTLSNGNWSGNPSSGANGQVFNGTCNSGYTGSPSITCNAGFWSAISGSCTSTACSSAPTALSNGTWNGNPTSGTNGQVVNGTCNSGYAGSPSITCNAGSWSAISGSCISSSCSSPPALNNGSWSGSSANNGQTLTGTCNGGYHSSLETIGMYYDSSSSAYQYWSTNPITITCNSGSYGSASGSCIAYPTTCPAFVASAYDDCAGPPVTTTNYNFPASANNTIGTASCVYGNIGGPDRLRCTNGVWADYDGYCRSYYGGGGC